MVELARARGWEIAMTAKVLGMEKPSLVRLMNRPKKTPGQSRKKIGRPKVISAEVGMKIRNCFLAHHQQWGPTVLACWAEREGLGRYSPDTIAKVIEPVKEPEPPKEPPRRYEITAPGVMWSEDGAGFKEHRKKKELLILQDECSRFKVNDNLVDGPANGAEVHLYLKEAFEKHGPPLILKHDGDSIFHEENVEQLLAEHLVVSLTSPPHYPPYNGKMERAVRDVKSYERALKRNSPTSTLEDRIAAAIHDLNEERPRPMLGGKTAREAFESDGAPLPDREEFYEQVMSLERWRQGESPSRRERNDARRIAVRRVLLRHGLMKEVKEKEVSEKQRTGP